MATIYCGEATFPNISAVIFDKDGTLADSHEFLRSLGQKRARLVDAQIPGVQEPLLMAFGLNGSQLNPTGLLAVGTRLENEIATAAYVAETGRDWVEALKIARSAFLEADQVFKRKADCTPLFDGVLEILQTLAISGIKVGILSADTTENVQDFIERYQVGSFVSLGLGIDQGPGKPDPTALFKACALLDVDPGAVLTIGDTTADLEMARAAGAAGFVGVTWGWTLPTAMSQADALIRRFTEIRIL